MKYKKYIVFFLLLIFIVAVLNGCAGSPFQLKRMDRKQLSTVPDNQLMRALKGCFSPNDLLFEEAISRDLLTDERLVEALSNKSTRTDLLFEEAISRDLLTDEEIKLIKKRQINIGMSENALIISWGEPLKTNTTVGCYGTHKQYVYYYCYVYVENGIVTAWQSSE